MEIKKTFRIRLLSTLLAVCMAVSLCVVSAVVSNAADSGAAAIANGLAVNVQDGQILQCWNWSFRNIKNNMSKIVAQGFSAVQTSPIQTAKEGTVGKNFDMWWLYYQPVNFSIDNTGNSALGTKQDFIDMCNEAHKYGVKIIVDAVLNHTGNNYRNDVSPQVISDIRNDPSCWHDISRNTMDWNNRWEVTQLCMDGLPDLNTANAKVQTYAANFLKECIDAGADGFRFDGAKHIETDHYSETAGSSFWRNVLGQTTSHANNTRGFTPYYYGEILDDLGGNVPISAYTQYMSVTEHGTAWDILKGSNENNSGKASFTPMWKGASKNKAVLWDESHDTYAHGTTKGWETYALNKGWANMASRAEECGMYFARPASMNQPLGTASSGGWETIEVREVNLFKNKFVGQSEYLATSGSIAYNVRGNKGVILVNTGGMAVGGVSVPSVGMTSGTYKDQITGNTFTVSNGTISGNIGSTGIAVVYNTSSAQPPQSTQPPQPAQPSGTIRVYFSAPKDWNNTRCYYWQSNGNTPLSWPGNQMSVYQQDNGLNQRIWIIDVPASMDRLIFSNGGSNQTYDYVWNNKNLVAFYSNYGTLTPWDIQP